MPKGFDRVPIETGRGVTPGNAEDRPFLKEVSIDELDDLTYALRPALKEHLRTVGDALKYYKEMESKTDGKEAHRWAEYYSFLVAYGRDDQQEIGALFNEVMKSFEGRMPVDPELKESQQYRAREVVNGIEISVAFDRAYKTYTVFLPQIEFGSERAYELGVSDQVVLVGAKPETAKKAFEEAKRLARGGADPYTMFLSLSDTKWE